MDLLSQLDESLDLLLKIMSSSISFISRKALHTALPHSTIPLTILGKTEAISETEMDDAILELVSDLVEKAEHIREIIMHLPTESALGGEEELEGELGRLEREMRGVNEEYRVVREEVESLRGEVGGLVRALGERRKESRGWLVRELEEGGSSEASRADGWVGESGQVGKSE